MIAGSGGIGDPAEGDGGNHEANSADEDGIHGVVVEPMGHDGAEDECGKDLREHQEEVEYAHIEAHFFGGIPFASMA